MASLCNLGETLAVQIAMRKFLRFLCSFDYSCNVKYQKQSSDCQNVTQGLLSYGGTGVLPLVMQRGPPELELEECQGRYQSTGVQSTGTIEHCGVEVVGGEKTSPELNQIKHQAAMPKSTAEPRATNNIVIQNIKGK